MAYEADRVVVEVIGKMDQFDQSVRTSAANFDSSVGKIGKSAAAAEAVLTNFKRKMADALAAGDTAKANALASQIAKIEGALGSVTTSANTAGPALAAVAKHSGTARSGMLELQHVARGAADQFAAGTPLSQIFSQHIAQLGQAAALSGSAFGKFGAFLSGPWGFALVLAAAALGPLVRKLAEGSEGVEGLVDKLREHARQTELSEQADRVWANTLDGLIERQKKLTDELSKRLQVQELTDQADLERQKADAEATQQKLDAERKRLADLQKKLSQEAPVTGTGPGAEARGGEQARRVADINAQIAASKEQIRKLEDAAKLLESGITASQIAIGQTKGKAFADLSAKAQQFGNIYKGVINGIIADNPTLGIWSDKLFGAAESLDGATKEAASAGVEFIGTTNKVSGFDRQLNLGQITVKQYTTEILKLAKALHDQAEAAKEANKNKVDPVKQFKQAVIGAEGTGPNRMGSPAAGIGQFMPSTWLSYFNRLFPDKAALSDAAKLNFRNYRTVAESVIDKATEDYVAVLKAAGQKLTAANLYAVHLLGSSDAKKFFAASPGTSVVQALGNTAHARAVASQNPGLLSGTVGAARGAIAKRIGDSSGAVSSGAVAIAQALEQEKERLRQFQNARASLEDDILSARRDQGLSAADVAAIEHAAVEAARKKYEDNIKALEGEGKYTDDEANLLIDLNNERAKLRDEIVERRKQQEQLRQQEARNENALTVQTGLFDAQKELLQSEEGLAKTASERKRIEDRLIDIQFEEERMRLQAQISLADRLKAEAERTKSAQDLAAAERAEADAAVARQKLQNLPQEQANAHTANAQTNASPLQAYFANAQQTADDINTAFEQIAANGLQTFNDALANAIVHFTSLRDVARTVLDQIATDLIKVALQQIELHTLGAVLGASAVASQAPLAAASAAMWAGPAALASLATLGSNAIPAQAAIASTTALAAIFGSPKAMGGRIVGFGSDRSDNILTPSSPGEFMIRAPSARSLGYDTLQYMNEHGRLPGGMADGGTISPMNIPAASPIGRGGFSRDDIRQLRGIVSDAAAAMPHVDLYASLDPAEVLQKALGTPTGHRAMLAHFRSNSGAFNASLRPGG